MASWWTELPKVWGFTTPFIYASAAYGFFHWLDKKASGPAKKAISSWLEPKEYDKAAVAAAIVELFDRVYTRPLLRWRALGRSASITLLLSGILIYEFYSYEKLLRIVWDSSSRPTSVGLLGITPRI